jgi:hypothetical protein
VIAQERDVIYLKKMLRIMLVDKSIHRTKLLRKMREYGACVYDIDRIVKLSGMFDESDKMYSLSADGVKATQSALLD